MQRETGTPEGFNNPMKMIRLNTLFTFLFLLLAHHTFAQSSSSWAIFRGNQQLNGISGAKIPDHPKLLWSFQTGDNIKSAPVIDQGKVVIGSTDGLIYCLSLEGKLLWKFETGNAIEAPALIHKNTVYAGNLDGTLFALDLNSGEKKWEYKTDNQIIGSANWWEDGGTTYIFVGSYDYYLHCVDANTGTAKWKYESDNFINGAAACQNGKIFFGGCDGFLHVVDVQTGKADKKIDVATYVPGSPALESGKAYLGDYDGRFFEVDIAEGKTTWVWEDTETNLPFLASPAISGDRIFIANHNKLLYCFNKNNGEKLWEYNTGSRVEASPVVTKDKVIVANMRGDLALVGLSDGKVVWTYEIGSQIISNPAVAGDRIYVGAYDGLVYCFGN
ncbi:outer membrane protein assembly factor BamB family protein [Mariniphaga sediminis]|uniref:outer membrane protein assembly factor BamB family protein n=1 Tax=Mariniphaga sediminis TaxID=1628158 RepID=UPI003566A941